MKALVIIDPQIDFITGTMAVPQAEECMDYLSRWMLEHSDSYEAVYVSMDQHPMDHCSFLSEGGLWPAHCVRYSQGAALWPAIQANLAHLQAQGKEIYYIEKAYEQAEDEYSAFARFIPQELLEAELIFLAGIAGDYCVRASEEDLLRQIPQERILRLEEAIAWINPNA